MSTQPITTCDFCSPSKRKTGANNWWKIWENEGNIMIASFFLEKEAQENIAKDACGRGCVCAAVTAFMDKIENRRDPKAHLKEK